MKKSTVYTKSQVKNMLEFDDFNNVTIYIIIDAKTLCQFSTFFFNSKELANEWLNSLCREQNLDSANYFVSKRTLRFY